MKSIALDFKNNRICFMTANQQGTERYPDLKKDDFNHFIPEKFHDKNSFTWDFENETFSVNQDILLHDGCIITKDDFLPELIIPMPGLKKRYKEFIAIMNYEEVDLKSEMPEAIRKLLGLDD